MENNKVNKTTKLWALNPSDPEDKKLLATFVIKDGKLVDSTITFSPIQERTEEGYFIDGARVTLKSDAAQFVELLGMNHSTGTYSHTEVIED